MKKTADYSQALTTFAEESRDLIAAMEEILLRAESGRNTPQDLHALFRCAHTIKGSGGLFGLNEVVRFTHVVENVLDRLRNGAIQFSSPLISLLLECQDQMATLVSAALEGISSPELSAQSDQLMERLKVWSQPDTAAAPPVPLQPATGAQEAVSSSGGAEIGVDTWHISLRFAQHVFTDGRDPLAFIHYLSTLGEIRHVETVTSHLPDLDSADPEMCYLGFEVALHSTASKNEIENVFEFVADSATIHIFPPHTKTEEFIRLIQSDELEGNLLGEILIACGTLTRRELDMALNAQQTHARDKRLGEVLVENYTVVPEVVDAALTKQRQREERKASEATNIKIPAARLDALIDHVGELVIAGAGMYAKADKAGQTDLLESASILLSLVEGIRDMTLSLRMVPIGEVFARFPRVVRDVSAELGKQINLVVTGADSELDKSMVEKIGDPLMHLIRNSMDHGIESAEERKASGKPATATIGLHAYHESGAIVVEVKDDGRGLNSVKILAKAVEKGLVAEGATLTHEQICRLILEPGFSTAETVTNLSGRGVGMDVVLKNIESMRGSLDIQSEPGHGTTMRICLPLTLAIIDGFHVGVGSSHYIVPLDMVVECVEFPMERGRADYMELRGEAMPYVKLGRLFGASGPVQIRQRVVVVRFANRRIGLVVDRIFGKCQTVIKPLGPFFENVPCVSGSTILGSGEVALIIDVAQLVQGVVNDQQRAPKRLATGTMARLE